ncbi:HET-domain-containing protein [Acephala macrosclerotiorum]|nr:HET-domain-containing protein [Acephala macrosclerotiorum]
MDKDLKTEAHDENHWGVRLVTIEAGNPGSDIVCTLSYTTLSQCKERFEALSYLWGDPNELKDILLDGIKFRVTINLHAALNGLRCKNESRTLWIDAICIDQSNMRERALQVQKMGTLYLYATRVIAWLGEEANGSNEAFAILGQLEELEGDEAIAQFVESTPDSKWEAFDTLAQRPYFRRVWMAQEVAVNGET